MAVVAVAVAGVFAGIIGALLGLGGGIFLVPFLVTALHLPFADARGISLMAVLATSSIISSLGHAHSLVNLRLAMVLQVATAAGALTGSLTSRVVSETTLTALFATMMLVIAGVMLPRLQKRNVSLADTGPPGPLGGEIHDPELGCNVVYRPRRMPLAVGVSFVSGNVSSLLGIGGGVLMVPALNAWCGIPLRVAGATSAFMIGVTASAALPLYWIHGEVRPHLAAAAVLGVLGGTRLGIRLVSRLRIRWLKVLLILVLLVVSSVMFSRL